MVGIPLTVQIENHLMAGMHFLDLEGGHEDRCPSLGTRVMLVVFRPLLAATATAYAICGRCSWPRGHEEPSSSDSADETETTE